MCGSNWMHACCTQARRNAEIIRSGSKCRASLRASSCPDGQRPPAFATSVFTTARDGSRGLTDQECAPDSGCSAATGAEESGCARVQGDPSAHFRQRHPDHYRALPASAGSATVPSRSASPGAASPRCARRGRAAAPTRRGTASEAGCGDRADARRSPPPPPADRSAAPAGRRRAASGPPHPPPAAPNPARCSSAAQSRRSGNGETRGEAPPVSTASAWVSAWRSSASVPSAGRLASSSPSGRST